VRIEAETLFIEHLDVIDRVTSYVCRRNHVDGAEAEDFTGHVKCKLIEGNYSVIRKFEGRSSFSTYLTTVIQRMFFQYRVTLWGKWRPSAEAKRLGDKGITLERLLTRDGYSLGEATQILTTGRPDLFTRAEIDALYKRLPPRMPRPVLVSDLNAPDVASIAAQPEDQVLSRERQAAVRGAVAALDRLIKELPAEEQIILRLRFWESCTIPKISVRLNLDPKKLYKRIEKLLAHLKKALEKEGIHGGDVEELLALGDSEVTIAQAGNREKSLAGPSHPLKRGYAGGRSRLSG